ncbi:hypothetical protein E2C01_042953 [Portunus trituberculatus]|uniref:Uncharacterized protein n=1 Tax=Portunus trituberculatus TaxID=210409 RepID=A0A5B7FW83_PORTR|nr:hypothetical protein [Portunus trituberculatus]
MEQDVLEFFSALVKANKDILCPAEELCCRLLMLQRQAVKRQLLFSPFPDVLFGPAMVARIQEDEHLASQQHALSSVVWRLASSFWGSASVSHWAR